MSSSQTRFASRLLCATLATLIAWGPLAPYAASAQDFQRGMSRVEREQIQTVEQTTLEDAPVLPEEELAPIEDLSGEAPVDDVTPTPGVEEAGDAMPLSLPGGDTRTAVTPQAISLPTAEGSVEGMGESFTPHLSSGTGAFSVPIAVAPGRAGVQPSFALAYSTSGGNGPVGFGWNLSAPFISRQVDRGVPQYADGARWQVAEDRLIYNGGQELVPVDSTRMSRVDTGGTVDPIPLDVRNWQEYRARVEGGFMRFFRDPLWQRWVVFSKDGSRFDFGLLPSSEGPRELTEGSSSALERDSGRVYRWMLTRMVDAHGSPVWYRYQQDQGQTYLSEVLYVSPASCGVVGSPEATRSCAALPSNYGSRVAFTYEPRQDVYDSWVSGWRIATAQRLTRVTVTAWSDTLGTRALVRRYHLAYADGYHSLLASVQLEGRPDAPNAWGVRELGAPVREGALGREIVGPTLPAMRFSYSQMAGLDTTIHDVAGSPPHSVDEARSELFDVNSDGLADLVVTPSVDPDSEDDRAVTTVFFNGFSGPTAHPAGRTASFSGAIHVPVQTGIAATMSFANPNIAPMDIDGDGRSDLLHMPRARTYGWFTPTRAASPEADDAVSPAEQGWQWTYAQIGLPERDADPRIDLGSDGAHIVPLDVNGDHLIDVVRTTGTSVQTWLNLGWLPGGDGRFGTYEWDGDELVLSTAPLESCLPTTNGTPMDFDDSEVRFGDMNGDGLQDVVRIRRGRVIYWPGRGDGTFGVGELGCSPGTRGNLHVEMATPPAELEGSLSRAHLADVDADGADDVLQVRDGAIDVWLNRGGRSFGGRMIADHTPHSPSVTNRIRLTDIDGSGTMDVLYATARQWQYVDLLGGRRPRLLIGVENGLGAETTMEYASSAEDYVRDLAQCDPMASTSGLTQCFTWSQPGAEHSLRLRRLSGQEVHRAGGTPVISQVIRRVTTTDHLELLGREPQVSVAEFAYHDGYYEGIEQEFRGFGVTDAYAIGDWNNPTSITRTSFHQGRRPQSIADDRRAWNPDESLKGREYLTETLDENGRYLASAHATLTVRTLAVGLDGRPIDYAFVSEANELRYDTTPFEASTSTVELNDVIRERVSSTGAVGTPMVSRSRVVPIRGLREARIRTTFDEVDNLGHVLQQTAYGHVETTTGAPIDQILRSHTETTRVGFWIWRTAGGWLDGDAGMRLGRGETFYDGIYGHAVLSRQYVEGVVPLDFGGESESEGGAMAMPQRAEDVIASVHYDVWGQPIVQCAGADLRIATSGGDGAPPPACLRYGTVERDPLFAQLAIRERAWVGDGSSDYLETTGTWERGMALVLSARAPNGISSSMRYDGFGRPVAAIPPAVDGCAEGLPTVLIRYELTTDPRTQPLSRVRTTTVIRDGENCAVEEAPIEGIGYVDGLGRARAALATGGEDGSGTSHPWVRSGISTPDAKGSVRRTYQSDFYDGSPDDSERVLALPTDIPYAVTRYDAFGRARGVIAEDGATVWTSHHALSTDVCDPLDNDFSSPHYRTCTTARADGHGRVIDQMLRNRDPRSGELEHHRLWSWYRQDGAVLALARLRRPDGIQRGATPPAADINTVVRTFTYDSVGRRLTSSDPDTESRSAARPASQRNWRYLFNRLGDLVAVRDPRGCGQNFFYDRGGRLLGEQYVSCAEAQSAAAEQPTATVGDDAFAMDPVVGSVRVDVRYYYDGYQDSYWSDDARAGVTLAPTLGLPTGVEDRGQRSVIGYDRRGNAVWSARQMAVISDALALQPATGELPPYLPPRVGGAADDRPRWTDVATTPADVTYDEQHTYVRTATFDHQGRSVSMTLPGDPDYDDELAAPTVGGRMEYDSRGLPARAIAVIGGTDYDVVSEIAYARDGAVERLVWGDHHTTPTAHAATVSTTEYDIRRRPIRMRTVREATATDPRTLGAVETVVDQRLVWDAASNLTDIVDYRDGSEWPAGFRPRTTHVVHDSLYRVIGAYFEYTQEDGSTTPDDQSSDYRDTYRQLREEGVDPMSVEPAPMVPASVPERIESLEWDFDFLGNATDWNDDSESFYERSIGHIDNGITVPQGRPSALYFASNIDAPLSSRVGGAGWLEVDYGEGGNVIAMTVHGQCEPRLDGGTCTQGAGDVDDRRTSLRTTCACVVEQHYEYHWDELDRIAEARRWDRNGTTGASWSLVVRQRYRYDGANQRTVKQTLEPASPGAVTSGIDAQERVALSVYPGDYERRGLLRSGGTYVVDTLRDGAETQYLIAGARLVWRHATDGALDDVANRRLTVGLTDLIQTTGAVLDLLSGDLVEASTYYPNGARETYLVDQGANGAEGAHGHAAAEPMGFTGKEADEEVGLVYFGERYLIPRIGRWASPDPLHVHASGGGEVMNSYHYVSAGVLQARDPLGLDGTDSTTLDDAAATEEARQHRDAGAAEDWTPVQAPDFFDAGTIESWDGLNDADWALADVRDPQGGTRAHLYYRRAGTDSWTEYDPCNFDRCGSAEATDDIDYAIDVVTGVGALVRVGGRLLGRALFRAAARESAETALEAVAREGAEEVGALGVHDASRRIARTGAREVIAQGCGTMTCVPVSGAMLLADRGIRAEVSALARTMGTSASGTEFSGLIARTLRDRGLDAAARLGQTVDDLIRGTARGDGAMAIIRVGTRGVGTSQETLLHAIVVDGVTERAGRRLVAIRDPGNLGSQYFLEIDEFARQWTGQAVYTGNGVAATAPIR